MNYALDLAKRAGKQLAALSRADRNRITAALLDMQRDPYAGDVAPLKGEAFAWRRRVGNYRIIYALIPERHTSLFPALSDEQQLTTVNDRFSVQATAQRDWHICTAARVGRSEK